MDLESLSGISNNDGFNDIYLTNLNSNKLYLNQKDGTFLDITERSRTDDKRWSISAAFFDYDRDGFLDLLVANYANYANFDFSKPPKCYARTTADDYCGPKSYRPVGNSLFRNLGNGTFENVTGPTGISETYGHALGVVTADFDNDNRTDIYIANDGDPNQLWLNKNNGKFEDEAYFSGTAVNHKGQAEASMGVDAGDYNSDGNLDIFVSHLMEETHTLYANDGKAIFEDSTPRSNIGLPDQRLTGFGTLLFDFDNDGSLDIFIANGSVKLLREIKRPGNSGSLDPKYPLGQKNQLFRNLANGKFVDVSSSAGPSFSKFNVSRGASFGDIDNDGDIDILVNNNNGPAELLINNNVDSNNWIGLRLLAKSGGRDMVGAKVSLKMSNDKVLIRRARTDGGYLSAHDPRVLIGIGSDTAPKSISVTWPDGKSEDLESSQDQTLFRVGSRNRS